MDKASWVKTESLSEEQELDVSSHDGEYCSKGVDRSKYCGESSEIIRNVGVSAETGQRN